MILLIGTKREAPSLVNRCPQPRIQTPFPRRYSGNFVSPGTMLEVASLLHS